MAVFVLIIIGFFVALPLVAGAILVAVLVRRPDPAPSQAAEAARRHSAVVNTMALAFLFVGAVLGFILANQLGSSVSAGVRLGLIPAAAGLGFAGVQAVGELTWPRPIGTLRRAPLTRRTAADVAPAYVRRVTWSWAALTTVALVACGLASDDGRDLTRHFAEGTVSAGPFPGWFYGVPLLVAAAVVLLAAEGVLRLIAHRPAVMDAAPEWDLGLRRVSAHRLLRGAQLVLGGTASGVLLLAGRTVHTLNENGAIAGVSTDSNAYALAGSALMLLAGAVLIASVVTMFAPRLPISASTAATPVLGTASA